ncbi:N-acylneuraminate cytidylyltransferase [Maribacter vaceletii]|uniref:N-acylneuraminate cytidylyltransferase n=1 Tax=Maribacter vaceletii TaxID=1206816 RepID=A0A495ED95_9FLAO|nr:acylneuraminate cytidylyltransferase [Maribacter vaceletii]RKR14776.1 N-acylneuraminate cytidylyltransferase [Maribacter vaceletii]
METIAFIPVRGGSKSIKNKNIKNFCGKPLVYWVIKAASESKYINKVIVATDDNKIKEQVAGFSLKKVELYNRQPQNATDTSSTESVMIEYLKNVNLDLESKFILIQATSPFLLEQDLSSAIEQMDQGVYDSALSVCRIKRFFWGKNGTPINYDYNNRPRRQDFDGILVENGAFYISTVKSILENENRLSGKILTYEMPEYSITEIDEPDDWVFAEYIMKKYILIKNKSSIKLVLTDVDGVLTDAGMYYSESGDEIKKFNTHDGMGFQLLREAGFKTGIITSENTNIVKNRAEKLKVDFLFQGKINGGKLNAAQSICEKLNITLDEVAYIGDDINCKELLTNVGISACPKNATRTIKEIYNINILGKKGGEGVFREFTELLLKE